MGRKPKDVFSYADELWTLVEEVATKDAVFEMEVPNVTVARKMRGKFYAFRQALDSAVRQAEAIPESVHHERAGQLNDYLQWARVTVCWFQEPARINDHEPLTVYYMHKNRTPDAELYRKALASARPGEVPDDEAKRLEESAKRVAEATSVPLVKKNPYY